MASIGEAPVTTLDGPLTSDVALALNTLAEVSREVQSEGWVCNTEYNYPLPPNTKGEIHAPANTLKIFFHDPSSYSVALRGTQLYDLVAHSYTFPGPVAANLCFLLPLAHLTETLRRYIVVKAARLFQDRAVGANQLHGYQEKDEFMARANARQEDSEMGRWNMQKGTSGFLGNWEVAKVLRR